MKKKIFTGIFGFAFLVVSNIALAQGPPQPPGPGEEDDQPVPVGSGLAILALLGVGLGGKKLYDARKKLTG